ncbi:MAG TPA: hypothetical protein VEI80_05370 [Candidatus Acidoferrales bacterium]|nr:hypothetical protein [Candidatus Acidoferrales bacterium]
MCSIGMVHRYTNNGKGGWTHALWPIQDDLEMNQEIVGDRRNYSTIADSAVPLILGFVTYTVAAVSTFSIPQLTHVGLDTFAVAGLTFVAGIFAIVLGYESIVLLGGMCSLRFVGFVAWVTKSRQLIESREKSPKLRKLLIEKSHLVYLPALLFFTSIGIGWDIYTSIPMTARTVRSRGLGMSIVYSLNFFATPQRANVVLYSLRTTPALILITVISGIVPSIALPYFRRFRVTGINAGPFHSSLLTAVVGAVVGVSIILSFLGIFYKILWAGGAPTSYHYALIVLVGLSLHYAAGTYVGRDRAESIVLRKLVEGKYDRKRILVLDPKLNSAANEIQLELVIQDRWET